MTKKMTFKIIRGTILGLLLAMVHLGCSTRAIKFQPSHEKLTPELEKYRGYVYNLSEGKLGTNEYSLGFIKTPKDSPKLLGECTFVLGHLNKEIDIVEDKWYFLSHNSKILLIAHEFRHCECNQYYHSEEYFLDGCSKSYMDSYLPDEFCVEDHMEHYIDELRRGCEA